MLGVGSGGKSAVNGVSFDEINDAYRLGLTVKVKGHRFSETREGVTYNMLHVTDFIVLEPEKLPLNIYQFKVIQSEYQNITELWNRVSGNQSFQVGRDQTGANWRDVTQGFMLYLHESERFSVEWNASGRALMELYAPQETLLNTNASRWGDLVSVYGGNDRVQLSFECHLAGIYRLLFTSESGNGVDVDLNISRLHLNTDEVFFIEFHYASSQFGGMGSAGGYPQPPANVITLGRNKQFSSQYVDSSYRYEAVFLEDEEIRFEYNATAPITLKLTGPGKFSLQINGTSIEQVVKLPITGKYVFALEGAERTYASFRCYRTSNTNYFGDPRAPIEAVMGLTEPRPPSWIPKFTPQSLNGSLSVSSYPLQQSQRFEEIKTENHSVISLQTDNCEYLLHVGLNPDCIPYPEGGDLMIQDLSLRDIVNAYDNNIPVIVTGFPFQLMRNETVYEMFHVIDVKLNRTQLVLETYHSVNLVSGRFHWGSIADNIEQFPVSFSTGYISYNYPSEGEIYGNQEHQFKTYLVEGEKIRIQLNSTNGVEYRLKDGYGSINFQLDDDFISSLNNVTHIDTILTAQKTGTYYFAIRGFSGLSGNVVFNCYRIP